MHFKYLKKHLNQVSPDLIVKIEFFSLWKQWKSFSTQWTKDISKQPSILAWEEFLTYLLKIALWRIHLLTLQCQKQKLLNKADPTKLRCDKFFPNPNVTDVQSHKA